MPAATNDTLIHASAFAYGGVGCLLLGAAGVGKTAALTQALLHGATLIADDAVQLTHNAGALHANAVVHLAGVLELRGLGLIQLPAPILTPHPIHLLVELTQTETPRLPAPRTRAILGIDLPLIQLPAAPLTPVGSLLLYLRAMQEGRILPPDWHPMGK